MRDYLAVSMTHMGEVRKTVGGISTKGELEFALDEIRKHGLRILAGQEE